jgi:maltokinase
VSAERGWTDVTSDALVAWLRGRRWFGDKGRVIRSARIAGVIPVTWSGSQRRFAVARAEVATDAGTSTYQLFLAEPGALTDAVEDDAFRRGLADAFAHSDGVSFDAGGATWRIRSESRRVVLPLDAPIRLSTVEQSNTSIILANEGILKLFRKLEPGIQPDVEVARFLTRERAFAHVPVLLGSVTFEDAAGETVAGMLQELVPGAVDGWSHALAASRAYFSAPQAPASHPFATDAEQLGVMTRLLHEALASGARGSDFDTRPAGADDVRRWSADAVRMIDGAGLDAAERARNAARVERMAAEISSDAGVLARTHGDYHLGQVLRSESGRFLAIDFEGEPARPLAERRARHSPLRDVAGMLRSFSYAAAVASGNRDTPEAIARADAWERGARDAFLRGYFTEPANATALLPRSRDNAARLIALFETEKIFYELRYELDHRPDWVWIPRRGIAKLQA